MTDDPAARPDPLGPDALDFWLGTWAVSWAGGSHGTNTIRRILDDRVIEESVEVGILTSIYSAGVCRSARV